MQLQLQMIQSILAIKIECVLLVSARSNGQHDLDSDAAHCFCWHMSLFDIQCFL